MRLLLANTVPSHVTAALVLLVVMLAMTVVALVLVVVVQWSTSGTVSHRVSVLLTPLVVVRRLPPLVM